MQAFAALMMSAVVAASVPFSGNASVRAAVPAEVGEAYVAELDADWNVSREIRVPCPADQGCAVDLGLLDPGIAAVHVRFDPMRAGAVAVTSRLEGRNGQASGAQIEKLALDRGGFGASQYEARMGGSGASGPIILMAVKVPGWLAPATHPSSTPDRT